MCLFDSILYMLTNSYQDVSLYRITALLRLPAEDCTSADGREGTNKVIARMWRLFPQLSGHEGIVEEKYVQWSVSGGGRVH